MTREEIALQILCARIARGDVYSDSMAVESFKLARKFQSIASEMGKPRPQTAQEIREVMRGIAAMLGVEVRQRRAIS